MARKTTSSSGRARKAAPKPKKAARSPSASRATKKRKPVSSQAKPQKNAADAIAGLLESPLVADILAAGAAAALGSFTQHRLGSRRDAGTKEALKTAAAAAATAMAVRLSEEIDEIVDAARAEAKRGEA